MPFTMSACRCSVILLSMVVMVGSFASPAGAIEEDASGRTTLLVMAPNGPVLVDLQILVEGQPYRLWVAGFLARKLDVNGDSSLTLTELELIPGRLMQQAEVSSAADLLRLALNGKETESVAVADFRNWFAQRLSRSFSIIAGAVQASEAVRLAGLIDHNGDGGISEDELHRSRYALRFRDLDDDQTYTAAELMPYRDPRNQQAAVIPDAANLPFIQLTDSQSLARATEQLLRRYGTGDNMDVGVLRLAEADVPKVDRNGDSAVDAGECRALLESPIHHVAMEILLSDRTNASRLDIAVTRSASGFCRAARLRRGRAQLVVDDMPVEIRARGGSTSTRTFFTSFLMQRMSIYDEDRNNYLSEEEFPQMQQQMGQQGITCEFADVDLNGDGMLFRDEITGYIERDAISTQSRIEVSVRQDGKTLFSLLDANIDRRLTPRELLEGFAILSKYDLNTDGVLKESELGTAYVLEIGLAQAAALRMDAMGSMDMNNQSVDAVLPGIGGLAGPEWFRRMDRNQDRDLSYREFLGTREQFDQLDRNQDGLMSVDEAAALAETHSQN